MPCASPRRWARRSWPTRPEDILANMARSGRRSYLLREEQWPPVVIATVHMDVVAWLQPDWHLDSKYADLTCSPAHATQCGGADSSSTKRCRQRSARTVKKRGSKDSVKKRMSKDSVKKRVSKDNVRTDKKKKVSFPLFGNLVQSNENHTVCFEEICFWFPYQCQLSLVSNDDVSRYQLSGHWVTTSKHWPTKRILIAICHMVHAGVRFAHACVN